ncbi:MAG: NADH-quinone oxidoreductase subunit A [Bacillota bacterium]|jgi:NADH:ubiquinone oxidoreductase subunit 3 (subunit A)|nr:NADH-quinone oxidoreductase subunit A [Clostridia bacterium]
MLQQYSGLGIYLIAAIIFPFIIVFVALILGPKRPNPEKLTTYECGLDTQGPTWVQFKINYFLYALVFVVFDVETVFLYPWAVKFQALGLFAFIEMIIFIAILVIGLWYAWKEGALEWM